MNLKDKLIAVLIIAVGVSIPVGIALGLASLPKLSPAAQQPLGSTDFNTIRTTPTNTSAVCGTNSTLLISTSTDRVYTAIVNDGSSTVYLGLGTDAVGSNGIRLNAGGGSYEIGPDNLFSGAIYCIGSSSTNVTVVNK
jgi:hypothetical protein